MGTSVVGEHSEKNVTQTLTPDETRGKCGHCNSKCPFSVDQMARMQEIEAYFSKQA